MLYCYFSNENSNLFSVKNECYSSFVNSSNENAHHNYSFYLTECLDSHNVCGKNIDCPNNKVYESCNIKKLLTLKTMICNDSLQWEHDIDCNASKNTFGVLNVEFKI